MTTTYHTPIPTSPAQPANAATVNGPLSQLDAELVAQDGRIDTLEADMPVPSGVASEYYDGAGGFSVPAGTGSTNGHVIQDGGVDQTQRVNLNFTGAGVSVVDTPGATEVQINGGGIAASIAFTATDKLLGRSTSGAGAGEEIPLTAAGRALIAAADVASQNTLLEIKETAYKIAPTVASNDLTLTLTHMDGTTPSMSRPLWFRIGDAWRSVTGALSVTLADGTNWFNSGGANLATNLVGYFAYVSYRTASTAVVLGISPIPHARVYSAFSATNTNAKHGAFSTAPDATDDVVNIGYFEATLSAGAGYTWTVPTFTTSNLIDRPTFETNWLSSATTFPAGFTATPPVWVVTYKKVMDVCVLRQTITSEGTSTATTFTFTAPVAPLESKFNLAPVFVKDNSAQQTVMGHLEATAGSTTIAAFKTWYQGVWTNTGAKNLFFNQIDYRY